MSVTIFGTCRMDGIQNNNNLHNRVNYTHSTKEVLQQIKFLLGHISFPAPFDTLCFRSCICENRPIQYDPIFTKLLNESEICVIEICSDKKYICDGFYLHHLCVDKRFASYNRNTPQTIVDTYTCVKQTYSEIEDDLVEIKKLLGHRKMIVVTHYNSKMNGEYIEARNKLITTVSEICEKHVIPVIKPSDVLTEYTQEEVMTADLGHYTDFGKRKFSEYINSYIKGILAA